MACKVIVNTLREKAINVRLVRRMYNPYRQDKGATEAAESAMGTINAGRFNKRLLRGCKELKAAQNAYNDLYRYVMEHTLPWMDEGVRVLPNANYFDFTSQVRALRERCDDAVRNLYNAWDQAVMDDRVPLNGMWNINDYPDKDRMLERWGISITFSPVPASTDFRIDMDEEDKQQLDAAVKAVEENASEYLLKEILKPVRAMAEKLAVPIGADGAVFRDTLVTNLNDVIERGRTLNINNDPRIEEVLKDIEYAAKSITPNSLRESPIVRSTTQKAMAEVDKKISQWF